jgi:hypothetical protein
MLSTSILLPLSVWAVFAFFAYTCHNHLKWKSHAQRDGCKEPITLQQESFLGYGMLRDSFEARVDNERTLGVHEMFTRILRIFRFILAFDMMNILVSNIQLCSAHGL